MRMKGSITDTPEQEAKTNCLELEALSVITLSCILLTTTSCGTTLQTQKPWKVSPGVI